jgi:hypothetical protein
VDVSDKGLKPLEFDRFKVTGIKNLEAVNNDGMAYLHSQREGVTEYPWSIDRI